MDKTSNVNALKFYRVVLEGIDRDQETPETFALKMTIRLRMTTPRAKSVVKHLPCVLRSNMSEQGAKRLKSILEEFGGICRIEIHTVTPGQERGLLPADLRKALPDKGMEDMGEGKFRCPDCGNIEDRTATYCTICQRKFRDSSRRDPGLGAYNPHDNPLDSQTFRPPSAPASQGADWRQYRWLIAGAAVVLVALVILLIK